MDRIDLDCEDSTAISPLFLEALRDAVAGHGLGSGAGAPADEGVAGQRFGRFVVLGELGGGGYGKVFHVLDPGLGCERALKVPNAEVLASPAALARFEEEARKSAAIDHPNVVRVLEADTVGGIPYLVMEFCPGGSLATWLKERPETRTVPARWAARLVAELADGAQQAHARGVLHRDLKPGNVLLVPVGADGPAEDPPQVRPKLGDFGLAKARAEADRGDTPSGAAVGTYAYMSPEQARGDSKAVGPASDVYGLGAILYELLARRRPHGATELPELLAQIADADPLPALREARPDVPRDLETICRTCLAKSPGDRYASAAGLADDLRRFLRDEPVRGSPWWKRARAWARRRRKLAAPAGVAVLAVGLLAAYSASEHRHAAEAWMTQIRTASAADLLGLLPRGDALGSSVTEPLDSLFARGDARAKLNAAVARARSRPECADYALTRLLDAPEDDLGPISRALAGRMESILERLEQIARGPTTAGDPPARERDDRRRANAAAALVLLGRPDVGFDLLRGATDPQARSFLIHLLGPAGVGPERIAERLDEEIRLGPEADASLCSALIQSLGEVPDAEWTDEFRRSVQGRLLDRYENSLASDVRGSAKWVLLRWELAARLDEIDTRVSRRPLASGSSWRVGPLTMTFVTFADRVGGRTLEVGDTEVTVAQFKEFRQGHRYNEGVSPGPDFPMNMFNCHDAMGFCNWLSVKDGIDPGQLAYREVREGRYEPVEDFTNKLGYRLLTTAEAELACRGGAATRRGYGGADSLLGQYAWYYDNAGGRPHPVASLKPNNFGIFDTLGDVREWCSDVGMAGRGNQFLRGGSFRHLGDDLFSDKHAANGSTIIDYINGFRVARTVSLQSGKVRGH